MNQILHPAAIDANRKGRLTLLQVIGLAGWVLFGGLLGLLGAAMFGGFIYGLATRTLDTGSMIMGLIFSVGMAAVLMWVGYLLGGKLLLDIVLGSMRQIEGRGMKYTSASG